MNYKVIPLLLSLFTISCNKYLDKPGDPTRVVPQTLEDVQLLLDHQINSGPINPNTDEFFRPPGTTLSQLAHQYYYTWKPNLGSTFIHDLYWSFPYSAIFSANLSLEVIENLPTTGLEASKADQLKGAAHFQRAFALLTIAWQFCKAYNKSTADEDLGAVIDLNADAFESLKRSSVTETYAQIISDAKVSLKYLQEFPDHPVRPSKLAAYGLLARIYLSMRNYDEAFEYSNAYLQKTSALHNYNDPSEINLNITYPLLPHRFGKEVIYYRLNFRAIATGFTDFRSYYTDSNIVASFSPDDLRRIAWFNSIGNYHQFKGSYEGNKAMTGICTDEMFLIRAECYARAGEIQKAMDDLNTLLITRWKTGTFIPFTANSKEAALQLILEERKKTLLFRGVRWMDIKRLNEEGANISIIKKDGDKVYVLPPRDPRFAMELPQSLVDNFGYIQNPSE